MNIFNYSVPLDFYSFRMNCIFEVNSFCQSVNCAFYYKHVIQVGDLCITMRGLTQILVNVDRMDITVHL